MKNVSKSGNPQIELQNENVLVYEQLLKQVVGSLMTKDHERLIECLNKVEELIVSFSNRESHSPKQTASINEWMTLANGAKYAGVSINSFSKFREMGLKVSQVEGIKRVSRKEIDTFMEINSF